MKVPEANRAEAMDIDLEALHAHRRKLRGKILSISISEVDRETEENGVNDRHRIHPGGGPKLDFGGIVAPD